MAPIRAGGGRRHRDGLRADRSSAIAQRRGDPCPQSHLSKAKSIGKVSIKKTHFFMEFSITFP